MKLREIRERKKKEKVLELGSDTSIIHDFGSLNTQYGN